MDTPMNPVEYLIIFISIVFGFALTEYLNGVGLVIKRRKQLTRHQPLVFWQTMVMLIMIQWWWAFWLYAKNSADNTAYFVLMISIPSIFYILVKLLFPSLDDIENRQGDMHAFYANSSKAMYITVAILFVIYSSTGLLWLGENEFPLFWHVVLRALVTTTCLVAAFSESAKTRQVANVTAAVVLAYFFVLRFHALATQ